MLIAFLDAFSEGLQVDADHAMEFAIRDLCGHVAAEIIAMEQAGRKRLTARDIIRMFCAAAEGGR